MGLNKQPNFLPSFSIVPEIRLRPSARQNLPLCFAFEGLIHCFLVGVLSSCSEKFNSKKIFRGEKVRRSRSASPRCPFPWGFALVSSGGFGDVQSGLRLSSPVRLQNFDDSRLVFPAATPCLSSSILFSLPLRDGQALQGKAVGVWAHG